MITPEFTLIDSLNKININSSYANRKKIAIANGISNYSGTAAPIQSFKNALQEWCADKKHRLPAPVYKTVSESGPDHKRVYERAVYVGERLVATGKGKNQKTDYK